MTASSGGQGNTNVGKSRDEQIREKLVPHIQNAASLEMHSVCCNCERKMTRLKTSRRVSFQNDGLMPKFCETSAAI